jgi:hypothetical protein
MLTFEGAQDSIPVRQPYLSYRGPPGYIGFAESIPVLLRYKYVLRAEGGDVGYL